MPRPRQRRPLHAVGALVLVLVTGAGVALLRPAPAAAPVAVPSAPPVVAPPPAPEPPLQPAPEPAPVATAEPVPEPVPELPVPGAQALFIDNFSGPPGSPAAAWWSHRADPWGNVSSDVLARLDGGGRLDVLPGGLLGTHVAGNPAGSGFEIPFRDGHRYRAEARLKMPTSRGNHASFWLRTFFPDAWGEVDVVESWNEFACPTNVTFYWLNDADPTDNRVKPCIARHVPEPGTWHTYAVEFTYAGAVPPNTPATEQTAARFYVDDTQVATIYLSPVRGNDAWPAAEFLNLQNKLNHQAATITGGDPRMQVDWVKVYSLDDQRLPPVISPLENASSTAADLTNGATDLPYVLPFEVSDDHLTSWRCTLDGAELACPDPHEVVLGRLPLTGHTFRIEVTNPAGSDSWDVTWTGGAPTTTDGA